VGNSHLGAKLSTSPLPQRIRAAREKLGITQQELGRLCGFGVNQISRYETGTREPSAIGLSKIAIALGVSMEYLIGLTDVPHGQFMPSDLNVYEREIVETFRRESWPGVIRLGAERLSK
jgi:transcriptional regulator with XRE-family HTH domain